jgi:hypothetical protein
MVFVIFIIFGSFIKHVKQYNIKKFNLININFKFLFFN